MHEVNENTTAYKLRKCRINCGLSQGSVAKALGLNRTAYTYYETGRSMPNLKTIVKLASIFSVEPSSLLPYEPLPSTVKDAQAIDAKPIYSLKKNEQSLLLCFRMLSKQDQDKVLAIITNMTKTEE